MKALIVLATATQLGFTVPPEAYASYGGEGGEENIRKDEGTQEMVQIFARNMFAWAKLMVDSKIGLSVQSDTVDKTGEIVTKQE